MKKIYNKKIISLLILCVFGIGLVLILIPRINTSYIEQDLKVDIQTSKETSKKVDTDVPEVVEKKEEEKILEPSTIQEDKVTLVAGEQIVSIEIIEKSTVYDAMQKAAQNKQIMFDGKEYPGLGFFVTRVGSLVNGDGKNLMYYVNDKEASVGVSSYVLSDGDIIEWKLK